MKKICILMIILVSIFLVLLTIFKFKPKNDIEDKNSINPNKQEMNNNIDSSILRYFIENEKKVINNTTNYKEKYSNKIVNEIIKDYSYELTINEENVSIKICIDLNSNLYVKNLKNNSTYKVSDVKFKSLYAKKAKLEYQNDIIFALSSDGQVYYFYLNSTDITKSNIYNTGFEKNVTNFVDLEFNNNIPQSNTYNIMVLTKENEIYDAWSNVKYDDSIYILDFKYYVYGDKTISNSYGNMLKGTNNENLKIKYYVILNQDNPLFNDKNINEIIITENNRIISLPDDAKELYIYDKKIKKLDYKKVKNNTVNISIIFEDDAKINFTGMYTKDYGFD